MLNYRLVFYTALVVIMAFVAVPTWAADENVGSFMVNGVDATKIALQTGDTVTIALAANIPGKKTLRAYSVIVNYDPEVIEVVEAVSANAAAIPAMNVIINEAGTISANGFSTSGALGLDDGAAVPFIELKVKALKAGNAVVSALFTAYGFDENDQFAPKVAPLSVDVQ